jgi:hypothetical protein
MPDYFANASQLDDSGAGTSMGAAKRTLQPLIFFLGYGVNQSIFLRTGRFYDVTSVGAGIPSIQRAHVKIRPYGTDSGNPCLDGRNWIAPNTSLFTYEGPAAGGGAVWSIQRGTTNQVARVFAASTNNGVLLSQRTIGEALRRAQDSVLDTLPSIQANLSESDCWYGAGSALGYRLYMWTPSQFIDPSVYYQGLSFYQSGAGTTGFVNAFSITKAQDILVQDIDVIGSRGAAFSVTAADTDTMPTCNIIIERCTTWATHASAVRVQQSVSAAGIAADAWLLSDVLIKDCAGYTNSGPREQEPNTNYAWHSQASDMYMALDRVQNVVFDGCLSVDARHSAFASGTFAANSTKSRSVKFVRCEARASAWNTYARGFGLGDCEPSVVIEQCTFDGMNVRSQPNGSVRVRGCVFKNSRSFMRDLPDTDGHISVESYILDRGTAGIGNERYIYVQPIDIVIENCSFGPSSGPAIDVLAYYANPQAGTLPFAQVNSGTITVRNNLFLDTHSKRVGKPFASLRGEGPLVIGTQTFENNAIYRPTGDVPSVVYTTGSTPVSTTYNVNTAPGFVSTLTVDPKVSKDMRPLSGSPLIGSGKYMGHSAGNDGRRFNFSPSIGAFEYFAPAKQRGVRK